GKVERNPEKIISGLQQQITEVDKNFKTSSKKVFEDIKQFKSSDVEEYRSRYQKIRADYRKLSNQSFYSLTKKLEKHLEVHKAMETLDRDFSDFKKPTGK